MRILVGHNYYQQQGGEDAVFQAEVEMLKQYGHEVCVYTRSNARIKGALLGGVKQLFSLRHACRAYDDVRALIRAFKPEVAHFHNTFFMMTPSVYDACRDEGVKVVQSLHNFRMACMNGLFLKDGVVCERCTPQSCWQGVRNRCYRRSWVLSALLADMISYHGGRDTWGKKVDCFIVAAQATRDQFIRLGVPRQKLFVKPHFIDDPAAGVEKTDGRYMLYAGRLSEEKGVRTLVSAWGGIKDVSLRIVGTGPLMTELTQVVRSKKLDNVQLLGFLSDREYDRVLSAASALIVPSLCYENFPRVVVEAYARGVPVLASRLGSLREIVHDGQTGALFSVADAADLRRCVQLAWQGSAYAGWGQKARSVYQQKYTQKINHDTLMDIYMSAGKK